MSPPSPRKPSWKDAAGSKPAATPRHGWQGQASADSAGKSARPWYNTRAAKLSYVFTGLAGVAAAIVFWIIFLRPPRPMRLALLGASYAENLAVPHNVPGVRSLDALESWAKQRNDEAGGDRLRQVEVQRASLAQHDEDVLKPLGASSLFERRQSGPVVVLVSAHGLALSVGGQVQPCLLRPEHPGGEHKPFPVAALLDSLAKLPDRVPKVLLLDLAPVETYWPLGQFHQGFVQAMMDLLEKRQAIPNLVILSSVGADERSWVMTGRGTTAFAHFVREAFRGAADKNGNERLTVAELFDYVSAEVERWVWHNRGRVQKPVRLYPRAEDTAWGEELLHCGTHRREEPPAPVTVPYEVLEGAWKQCLQLRDAEPAPHVYTPQLWRKYLETLLRAEELFRAGDDASARKLLDSLGGIERSIVSARAVPRDAMFLTLTMPGAFGVRSAQGDRWAKRLEGLWRQAIEEGKTFDELKKEHEALFVELDKTVKDRTQRHLVRLQLSELVLRRLEAGPESALPYARQLLALLDDRLPPWRPAEAHYAVMLRPDADSADGRSPILPLLKGKGWPVAQKAIGVRLRAEQAALGQGQEAAGERLHAYAERLVPWLRSEVEGADTSRRDAENALVTSLPERWKEAGNLLETAAKRYQTAQLIGRNIRRGLRVRDRLFAELPFYTHWLARVGASAEFSDARLIDLWKTAHDLDRRLDRPADTAALLGQSEELAKQAVAAERDLTTLEQAALRIAAKEEAVAMNRDRWQEIDGVLTVPFLPANTRAKLLRASDQIAQELDRGSDEASALPPDTARRRDDQARQAGQRQGRLALAELGQGWDKYRDTENALERPEEGAWHRSLQRAGQQYAEALLDLADKADKATTAAADAPLPQAGRDLRTATRVARAVPAYLIGAPYLRADPVAALRRLGLHDLLVWQAARTRLDFWAAENNDPEKAYFRLAGRILVNDARALVVDPARKRPPGQKDPRPAEADAELGRLNKAKPPVLTSSPGGEPGSFRPGPAQLYPTDEDYVWRSYVLEATADLPPGLPVRWVETDQGKGLKPLPQQEREKRSLRPGEAFRLVMNLDPRPLPVKRQHRVLSYFRGHTSEVRTELNVQRDPDLTTTRLVPPRAGRVAVMTRSDLYDQVASRTAIAIVLDSSGSMKGKRWEQAKAALRKVLEDLPRGVWVSLRVYGAESPDYKVKAGEEYTVIKRVWPARPWNPSRSAIDRRMKDVDKLEPTYYTPLIRSTLQARDDFPANFFGSRTIVVLTDGADSNFYPIEGVPRGLDTDIKKRHGYTIRDVMRSAFADSDIQVKVVGFAVSAKDKKDQGFKELETGLKDIGGEYLDAPTPEQLAQELRRTLMQMFYWVDPEDEEISGRRPQGNSLSRIDLHETPRWVAVTPGDHRVYIPSVRARRAPGEARTGVSLSLRQRVAIAPGDSMLLELVEGKQGLTFQRILYGELEHHRVRGFVERAPRKGDWLLSALQNQQRRGEARLSMMLTLEKEQPPLGPNNQIRIVHPRWAWFEVPAPDGKGSPPRLRSYALHSHPAPAWGLDLPRWPSADTPSAVQAWWLEANRALPVAGTLVKPAFKTPLELANKPWPTEKTGHKVTIERVSLERCRIETEPGVFREAENCLVFRLLYPVGQEPFFVHLPGFEGHQQHRFYTRVGKYTGIFWSLTKEDVERLRELQLISVADCKRLAGNLHVPRLELGKPNEIDRPNR